MKPTKVLSLLLCVLMLCTIVLVGCNKKENASSSSTPDEASSVATILNETEVSSSAEPITEPVTSTEAEAKETTKPKETILSDKADNGNSDNNSDAGPVDSQEQKPMTCTVTVADKDYTYKLGEKFTYTCYLKTPCAIEDIQAQVLYSGNQLKLVSTDAEQIFPVMSDYAVFNLDNPGIIKYNATRYKGIGFDTEEVLVSLTFEVIFGGTASVTNSIEVMTGTDETLYADNFTLHDEIKIRETIG